MQHTERVFPSTTFVWRKVKIQAPPRPQTTARAKRAPLSPTPDRKPQWERDRRRATGMLIQYRGGPECFYEITHAGKRYRVPGHLMLHDAMSWVLSEGTVTNE